MKRLLVAAVFIIGSIAYVFVERPAVSPALATDVVTTSTDTSAVATPAADTASASPAQPTAPTPTPVSRPTPTPVMRPRGQYADGTYTGSVADAYYGYVQVQAIVSGGKLTNVRILQYPSDRGTSIEINRQALPILVSEAISAQSANIDAVSGASETSPAFVQSLSAALSKAKA